MDTLKINPKILAAVFASVVIIADLVPAPNLGPGLIVSSYNWAASQVQSPPDTQHANQKIRAKRSQSRNPAYNQ
ncbi:hypothetical protein [Acaryochloris marina]|uniref:Uncharacterized protein n=1 Tax=Acaryochloris marina (strain MBIC 11017) TaxID=329726 RepID=B0BZ01_ACAM1|nr:hypothetical protein [Acaryochloris marina]ABW28301.1 hypothetical protein AM1_3307 [Acaryochloris marina MBIC11017]BDM77327.1 hypothetical protein AM10699_02010 [Acaryochloris marina MBIC10699]